MFHNLDRVSGDYRPITADVFLTNYCNNRCSWCTYNRWEKSETASFMSIDKFREYLTKLVTKGVRGVILTGGGEPTINPDFDLITAELESRKIHYGINTNFNELKFFKPDYLKVSLDGYDEESYYKIRGVRAYSKVVENIEKFAEWKKENSLATNIGIQQVATNVSDVYYFWYANKKLPVDYIVFRPVESTGGKYYENDHEYRHILDAIKELQKFDDRVVLNYKWDYLNRTFDNCVAHWAQIAIDEKGNVIYCCHKPFEIIGHITDSDIMEKYARAKTDMKMCDVPCRMTAPNEFMENYNQKISNPYFI
jgi:MoaA/NifB/PqqE/SkfB family radical SAM enzyme